MKREELIREIENTCWTGGCEVDIDGVWKEILFTDKDGVLHILSDKNNGGIVQVDCQSQDINFYRANDYFKEFTKSSNFRGEKYTLLLKIRRIREECECEVFINALEHGGYWYKVKSVYYGYPCMLVTRSGESFTITTPDFIKNIRYNRKLK